MKSKPLILLLSKIFIMDKIICRIPVVPMRIEPNHRSEQVSQMLFGETAEVIDRIQDWYKIVMDYDSCGGWIECDPAEAYKTGDTEKKTIIIREPFIQLTHGKEKFILYAGSEVPLPDSRGRITIINRQFRYTGSGDSKSSPILTDALQYLNAPYQWGGRTFSGIDCSGLVQILFKTHGLSLPRNSKDQACRGTEVKSFGEIRPGDLAFFENEDKVVTHVGLYLGNGQILHASKWVRIDTLDEQGIYRTEQKRYTHKLSCIRRLL